jgi:CRP/FNR family transcriptional regulator, cyclic AMP receptor protein
MPIEDVRPERDATRRSRPPVHTERGGAVRLLEEDAALGRHLDPRTRAAAERVVVARVRRLRPGLWEPSGDASVDPVDFGLLMLDGVMTRRVAVGDRRSAELLTAGDLLRPGDPDSDPFAEVRSAASWRVLRPARLAVLDQELVDVVSGLRGLLGELAGRAVRRARTLAVLLAIAQTPELAARVRLVLWHLADRWGRRRADGVAVELPFGQETLAELAAAQRTSVNEALRTLEERALLRRPRRGEIVLLAPPGQEAETAPDPEARFGRGLSARRQSPGRAFGAPTLDRGAVRPADSPA